MKKLKKLENMKVDSLCLSSHFREETICSHHESDNRVTVEFNLYSEVIQACILDKFSSKISKLGISPEVYTEKIKKFAYSLSLQDMDRNFLKPEKLSQFCELLGVSPRKLFDKYYTFVFSSYGEILVNFRRNNNLSQKQFSKLLSISPVDLSLFERGLKYPTRKQYAKLTEVLQLHDK